MQEKLSIPSKPHEPKVKHGKLYPIWSREVWKKYVSLTIRECSIC